MVFHRLSAFQIHPEAAGVLNQRIQIILGLSARIGMDDADADTNSFVPPGKCPGISARCDLAANNEDGFPFVVVRSVEIVLGTDADPTVQEALGR